MEDTSDGKTQEENADDINMDQEDEDKNTDVEEVVVDVAYVQVERTLEDTSDGKTQEENADDNISQDLSTSEAIR